MAKRFLMIRDDHDAVNEPGVVAEGVVFEAGGVAINWTTPPRSVQFFGSLADLLLIQKKNTITRIQWIDGTSRDPDRPRPSGVNRLEELREKLHGMMGGTEVSVSSGDRDVNIERVR